MAPELSTIDSAAASGLWEITSVSVSRGAYSARFAPRYRIEGTVGATDLILFSWGGTTFRAGDDVQVVPTYHTREQTTGRYGHVTMLEVTPARSQDETALRDRDLSTPLWLPQPVLVPLSASP